MKELVFLDSIDSPVGNIYIILQTKSLATVMRTSYKYGNYTIDQIRIYIC